MKFNHQKGFIVPLIGGIVALLIAGGIYWAWHNKSANVSDVQNNVTASSTEGWNTYSNDKYGFTFRYPVGWSVNDQSFASNGKPSINVLVSSPVHSNLMPNQDAVYLLEMGVTSSSQKMISWQGFYKSPFLNSDGGPVSLSLDKGLLENSTEYKNAQKIFDSAHLANLSSSSGWKTYTNSQYGFSLMIPENALVAESASQKGGQVSVLIGIKKIDINIQDPYAGLAYDDACNTSAGGQPFKKTINTVVYNVIGVSRLFSGTTSTSASEYCSIHNGYGIEIIPQIAYGNGNTPINVDTDIELNQMLSTFKFTSVATASNPDMGDYRGGPCPVGQEVSLDGSSCVPNSLPLIKILSPNGGEIWRKGTIQTIHWDSHDASNNKVDIKLICSSGSCLQLPYAPLVIATNVNDTQNTYSWYVGSVIPYSAYPPLDPRANSSNFATAATSGAYITCPQ
jgi:hypothetical protein